VNSANSASLIASGGTEPGVTGVGITPSLAASLTSSSVNSAGCGSNKSSTVISATSAGVVILPLTFSGIL